MAREMVVIGKLKGKKSGSLDISDRYLILNVPPHDGPRVTNSIRDFSEGVIEMHSDYDFMNMKRTISWRTVPEYRTEESSDPEGIS